MGAGTTTAAATTVAGIEAETGEGTVTMWPACIFAEGLRGLAEP